MITIDHLLFTRKPSVVGYDTADEGLSWVTDAVTCVGGKGGVPAMYLSAESCDFSLMCQTGHPEELLQFLPQGFPTEFFIHAADRVHEIWITVDTAGGTNSYVRAGAAELRDDMLENAVTKFIEKCDIFYLSCESVVLMRAFIDRAESAGKPIVTNLSLPLMMMVEEADPSLLSTIVKVSHCLIMNELESTRALSILGRTGWRGLSGPDEIVITNGAAGGRSSMADFRNWHMYHAIAVPDVACVVGAGDTFAAAYVRARFLEELDTAQGCDFAAQAAAAKLAVRSSSVRAGIPMSLT